MISKKTYNALLVLRNTNYTDGMPAKQFAFKLWGKDTTKERLFNACTNTGNGACCGKKAWLCAGSLLGRLKKKGYVKRSLYIGVGTYYISDIGKKEMDIYEKTII